MQNSLVTTPRYSGRCPRMNVLFIVICSLVLIPFLMIWESPYKFSAVADRCIYSSIMESMQKTAENTPDKKALTSAEDPSHFLTYSQLLEQIGAIETFLDQSGFKKGEVGATVMPNYIEMVPFYWAILGRGGIFTGMMPTFTEFEINRQLSDGVSTVVLTSAEHLEKVKKATEKMDHDVRIVCVGGKSEGLTTSWKDVIGTKGSAQKRSNDIHDIAVLPYSSGTTGMPKGVMLSHYNIMSGVFLAIRHTEEYVPHPVSSDGKKEPFWSRTQLVGMPFYHLSGNFFTLCHLYMGASVVLMSKFNLKIYLESIQKYKIFNLNLSPPALLQMVKDPIVDQYDLSSLRYINSSSAPLAASLGEEFCKKFPNIMLAQLYAMSECLHPLLAPCDRNDNYSSAGYVSPGFQAKIVSVESGKSLGVREEGEVLVKGPCVMKGYLNRPDATKETVDDEGWLHTGDIGYFNEKGELFIVDRKKELIKVNAVQCAPAEYESVVGSDNRVKDVGVVGIPHSKHGEVAAVFVVKNDENLTKEDVECIIKERMAEHKWPEGLIVFVESIPKLPSGKILRRQLRQLLAN